MVARKTRASVAAKKKKHLVVHLGNIGEFEAREKTGERTIRLASRLPKMKFVGIDLRQPKANDRKSFPKNVKQKKVDFVEGLNSFKDNSVYAIRSELAVGHFDQKGKDLKGYHAGGLFGGEILTETPKQMTAYTNKITSIAYKKLRSGGKLKLVVGKNILKFVINAINSSFRPENVKIAKMSQSRKRGTYWEKKYKTSSVQPYRIIAIKKTLKIGGSRTRRAVLGGGNNPLFLKQKT